MLALILFFFLCTNLIPGCYENKAAIIIIIIITVTVTVIVIVIVIVFVIIIVIIIIIISYDFPKKGPFKRSSDVSFVYKLNKHLIYSWFACDLRGLDAYGHQSSGSSVSLYSS